MKKIKNASGTDGTWCGQLIVSTEYYELQATEYSKWANDSTVLTDIGSGDLVVNNGTSDIADVATAINFLKDIVLSDTDGTPLVRTKPLANTDNFLFRGTGFTNTATKNSTTNIDYKLPEDRFINGLELILKNHVFGDTVCLKVVDVDNILGYGAGVVLNQFGYTWNVYDDRQNQGIILIPYPAKILKDLYIRLTYVSHGTTDDVQVGANVFFHKKQ